MTNAYDSIIGLLEEKKVAFNVIEHEIVHTSEEASKVRGVSIENGAKSLLLKTDKDFILIVLSGNRKLD
jgi:prolyl-tRNA editing enzyme YbaK/EbsC (Cys-tRNA(Pro) deacylase)